MCTARPLQSSAQEFRARAAQPVPAWDSARGKGPSGRCKLCGVARPGFMKGKGLPGCGRA